MKLIQKRLLEAFEKHALKVAIEYGKETLTYGEINQKSSAIMQYILKNNKKGAHIGVCTNNRLHVIVSLVGILRAGGVFTPLEPTFPTRRLTKMIRSADVTCVLCDSEFINKNVQTESCECKNLDEIFESPDSGEQKVSYEQEDPVYIYYTSGSTGEPKPVLGKNIGLTHFIAWEAHEFEVEETYRFSQFTNIGFDVFLRDTLVALCSGACLCIPEKKEIILDSASIQNWINNQKINFIHCVPSVFELINADGLTVVDYQNLKYVLLAGEKIATEGLKNWYSVMHDRVQLVNLYGPTETTLAKLFYRIQEDDQYKSAVPVGKPIDGAEVLVLNENMKPCDIFETGDVYIRTPFRTYGYYKNEELNNQVFISYEVEDGERDIIYKTGDLGRMLADENLELLGRKDRQVKIRGMRIELGEIENVIKKKSMIKDAVVVMKQLSDSIQLLYAYVVTSSDSAEAEDFNKNLMEKLEQELPQYMMPAYILEIDEIPKTINGKIDYSKLKDPLDSMQQVIEPRDEIESKLLDIWKMVLGIDTISIDDSFFEKGGNSLSLMNLVLNISETFHVEINFEQIALENTIERQAIFIKEATTGKTITKIPRTDEKESYQILESQKRLYYLQQKEKDSSLFNLSNITKITGNLDVARLERALNQVVEQQENLRSYFAVDGNDIKQFIKKDVTVHIEEIFLEENENIQEKAKKLIHSFELDKAPLFRTYICKVNEQEYYLLFDFHHIIYDGYSNEVLIRNLAAFFKDEIIEPMEIQFKDYAEFVNSQEEIEKMKQHEEFWLKEFDTPVKPLFIPEKAGMEVKEYRTAVEKVEINEEILSDLKELAQKYDTTLFTVLLSSYYILLSGIETQEDIVVGIPVSGRSYNELNNIVGMFVNTIAFRQYPSQRKTCEQFLLEVKDCFIKALANQNYQYNDLVVKLNRANKISTNSLFKTMFQMQNYKKEIVLSDDIKIERVPFYNNNEYRLNFSISEYEDYLSLSIFYLDEVVEKTFVLQLLEHYIQILTVMTKKPTTSIQDCVVSMEKDQNLEADFDFK